MVTEHSPENRPLLLDCDPGLDDALAILALSSAAQRTFRIEHVVACGGNSPLEQTYANARLVLDHVGDAPALHAGLPLPSVSGRGRLARHHGDDGLGGLGRAAAAPPESTGPAVIVDFATGNTGAATILCTGPLTDLAAAIATPPGLARLPPHVVVMGGAFGPPAGNATMTPEFNWWANPEAAEAVCAAGLPVEVVPLDITERVAFTASDAEHLAQVGSSLAAALLARRVELSPDAAGTQKGYVHDAVAAAILLEPSLVRYSPMAVTVATTGSERGRVMPASDGRLPISVARSIDSGAAHDLVVDLLQGCRVDR
jgi:inosine-uridine nucleoside N-ribohydrolase